MSKNHPSSDGYKIIKILYMSFFGKLLGFSKKDRQIMEQPEHEIQTAPPDDLMVIKKEQQNTKELGDNQNKDSP